jgi:hypothetical protein
MEVDADDDAEGLGGAAEGDGHSVVTVLPAGLGTEPVVSPSEVQGLANHTYGEVCWVVLCWVGMSGALVQVLPTYSASHSVPLRWYYSIIQVGC